MVRNVGYKFLTITLSLFIVFITDTVSSSVKAAGNRLTNAVRLTVDFKGMSGVHTEVRVADGVDRSATGKRVKRSNWKKDKTQFELKPGLYDLRIRKGSANQVIDNVDCRSSHCIVDNITAKLTVSFPKMSGVHVAVMLPDNNENTVSGRKVLRSGWNRGQAVLTVFRQTYDVQIRKSGSEYVVDDIDCTSGSCAIDELTAEMTVHFQGLHGVHTIVRASDQIQGTATGKKVARARWKQNLAVLAVLPGIYDVQIRKGGAIHVVDDVDCTPGFCSVDPLTVKLTVHFPGLKGVHTTVLTSDQKPGTATGRKVARSRWKRDQAILAVVPGVYDVQIRKGGISLLVENVDCRSKSCTVDGLTAKLLVKFPGLSGVHARVVESDGVDGTATGKKMTRTRWKHDEISLTVFNTLFDVILQKGPDIFIVDDVDCSSGSCIVEQVTSKLAIEFPGLKGVHSDIRVPDDVSGTVSGKMISRSNYRTHETEIVAFRNHYDVRIRHAETTIFDDVDCSSGNCTVSVHGNVQATLIDGDRNTPIAGQPVKALEKLVDGSLAKIGQGITTETGLVTFTLNGFEQGHVFVLETDNPFGNRKKYYSPVITEPGVIRFVVTENGENTQDLDPPRIGIGSPKDGESVSGTGFQITGTASDNRGVDKVLIRVDDPVKGRSEFAANYSAANSSWSANVDSSMVSLGSNQTVLTATAVDKAHNQSVAVTTVSVVNDDTGPQISIVSHADNDSVAVTGFLLSGSVTDQTGVASLTANLQDPLLGITIANQPVAFAGDGSWNLTVASGTMTEGEQVTVTLDATDSNGNPSTRSIVLNVTAGNSGVEQIINRITFGATPSLLQKVKTSSSQAYLDEQLDPNGIDDSVFTTLIAANSSGTKQELQVWTLMHMIHSRKQLQEVMTWFWDNHFNTDIKTKRKNALDVEVSNTVAFELAENQAFRANALGNFRNLLEISAKSPSMLIYLDSISNVLDDSNENYTREVLELHTMGVDGGFSNHEIHGGAEIFTGWHLQNDTFFFDQSQHNAQQQTFLGVTIPSGGVEQGEMVLDIIASHPSTASFICGKLIEVFVNDVPPQALVSRCAATFLATSTDPNQVTKVLREILESPEFYDPANYRNKIKTPLEFVVGVIRNLEATTDATDLVGPIRAMGIRLYENPVPTGWSENGEDWINSALLIERIKWINRLVRNQSKAGISSVDPVGYFQALGFGTADGIVGYLMQLGLNNDFTALSYQQALDVLGPNGIHLSDPDADDRLRELEGTVFSFPQYQFQ